MKIFHLISHVFLFVLLSSSFAQVRVGLLAGINSTDFAGDDPPNSSFTSDIGYEVGIMGEYYVLDDVSINLQPMYSYRSTLIQYDVNYQYEPYDSIGINFSYFEIPFNVKVVSDNRMSYVSAGLTLAIPQDANAVNNRSGNEVEVKDRFESYIWKASFGVGIQFHIGKPVMFIELGYTQSLTNLTAWEINEIELNNKLKSNSLQLVTGILFTL